jgi:hypothetical protein
VVVRRTKGQRDIVPAQGPLRDYRVIRDRRSQGLEGSRLGRAVLSSSAEGVSVMNRGTQADVREANGHEQIVRIFDGHPARDPRMRTGCPIFGTMPDEEIQERGREGVGMVKAWLEATTWMDFPANSYEDGLRCTVPLLGGGTKKFDLRGDHLGDKNQRRGLWVECKRYSSKGGQLKEYRRFLAIAYSYHAKQIDLLGGSVTDEFLWVTSNPFDNTKYPWAHLRTEEHMIEALADEANADVLGDGHEVDEKLARKVAAGIWLLVFDEKQMDVTLSAGELKQVMTVLEREGPGLWQH